MIFFHNLTLYTVFFSPTLRKKESGLWQILNFYPTSSLIIARTPLSLQLHVLKRVTAWRTPPSLPCFSQNGILWRCFSSGLLPPAEESERCSGLHWQPHQDGPGRPKGHGGSSQPSLRQLLVSFSVCENLQSKHRDRKSGLNWSSPRMHKA